MFIYLVFLVAFNRKSFKANSGIPIKSEAALCSIWLTMIDDQIINNPFDFPKTN